MRIGRLAPAALTAAAALLSTTAPLAANDDQHGQQLCGPQPSYACGEILVILQQDPAYGIEHVIEDQGGNPQRDLLFEFEAVRDLLLPESEARDFSPAIVYAVAVPVGSEEAAARAYATDQAVYAASVNRETVGTLTPNTAMQPAPPIAPPLPHLTVALLAVSAIIVRGQRGRQDRAPNGR